MNREIGEVIESQSAIPDFKITEPDHGAQTIEQEPPDLPPLTEAGSLGDLL
ncbi:hypothetical protein KEM48_003389 [Puccinia striiformis f. sp. tritici PST-130]|nr:hypothetical protein KEM48_003389 [Puccinia striiformis f. sp. tritici PST-130]